MIAAFAYLIGRTFRNRLAGQLRRLKQPKYALAAAVGAIYFWWVYFRPASGYRDGPPVFRPEIGAFIPLLLLVYLSWAWLFGADKTALAFSEAEVAFLFPAPVTRRQLLGFKLARAQLQIVITSILWVALFHKGSETLPPPVRVLGFWVFLSTLNLHRLGVALAHASAVTHGLRGLRRNLGAALVLTTIGAVTIWGTVQGVRTAWELPTKQAALAHMLQVLTTGAVGAALWPIRATVELAFASDLQHWVRSIPAAAFVLAVNLLWVIRADHAFEEAAAESSSLQAKRLAALRARRSGGAALTTVKVRRTIPLAATGPAWIAIVWKNLLSLMRSGGLRAIMWPGALAIVVAVAFADKSSTTAELVLFLGVTLAGAIALFAPVFARNDLRADLLHLQVLKTLPLSGRQIVAAQILGGALPVTVSQLLLVTACAIANGSRRPQDALPGWVLLGLLAASPLVLLAFNAANFAIHNALALLFPGWIRLGAGGPGGIETMGLGILTLLALVFALSLLVLVPGAVGIGIYFALGSGRALSLAMALALGAGVLAAEVAALSAMLGGAFDRVEPTQVA